MVEYLAQSKYLGWGGGRGWVLPQLRRPDFVDSLRKALSLLRSDGGEEGIKWGHERRKINKCKLISILYNSRPWSPGRQGLA